VNKWIVELNVKFEIWRSRGEFKEVDLPMSEKVIPDMEKTLSRALIRGACYSCGSGLLSHSTIQNGAYRGTRTNVHRAHHKKL
jgi:hypothetical protein